MQSLAKLCLQTINGSPRSARLVKQVNRRIYRIFQSLQPCRKEVWLADLKDAAAKTSRLLDNSYALGGVCVLHITELVFREWCDEIPSGESDEDLYKGADPARDTILFGECIKRAARLDAIHIHDVPLEFTFQSQHIRQTQLAEVCLAALVVHHPRAKLLVSGWRRVGAHLISLSAVVQRPVILKEAKELSMLRRNRPFTNSVFGFAVRYAPFLEKARVLYNNYDDGRHIGSPVLEVAKNFCGAERTASLKSLEVHNAHINAELIREWSLFTHLDRLRTLTICGDRSTLDPSCLGELAAAMPNLVDLCIDLHGDSKHLDDFSQQFTKYLTSLSPLQTLAISSFLSLSQLWSILSVHGETLTSLHFGGSFMWIRGNYASAEYLSIISSLCPNLRSFYGAYCSEKPVISSAIRMGSFRTLVELSKFASRLDCVQIRVPFPPWAESNGSDQAPFMCAYEIHRCIFPPTGLRLRSRFLLLDAELERPREGHQVERQWTIRPSERDDKPNELEIAKGFAEIYDDCGKWRWQRLTENGCDQNEWL